MSLLSRSYFTRSPSVSSSHVKKPPASSSPVPPALPSPLPRRRHLHYPGVTLTGVNLTTTIGVALISPPVSVASLKAVHTVDEAENFTQ
ncbi:hypothetical protein LguiA_002586 [Lonicera macranthoides]